MVELKAIFRAVIYLPKVLQLVQIYQNKSMFSKSLAKLTVDENRGITREKLSRGYLILHGRGVSNKLWTERIRRLS